MTVLTAIRTAVFLTAFLSTAATAMPVQFTYISNTIDDEVLEAHFEDCEVAYLKENSFDDLNIFPRPRAEVVLGGLAALAVVRKKRVAA